MTPGMEFGLCLISDTLLINILMEFIRNNPRLFSTVRQKKIDIAVVSLIILLLNFINCRVSTENKLLEIQSNHPDISWGYFGNKKKLFLVYSNCKDVKKEILIFIHGSPGGWKDYYNYLINNLLKTKFCIITLDRPGYGNSLPKDSYPELNIQAELIIDALEEFRITYPKLLNHTVFIGHSFGGPIIASVSKQITNIKAEFIFISSPIDPQLEEIKWYNKLVDHPLIQWLIPTELIHSNNEMLKLKEELNTLVEEWKPINYKFKIIHGKNDFLVPFDNVVYFKKYLGSHLQSSIELQDENHFIPWTKKDVVLKTIME
jgi:surfactin synthase thioesterase subunit